MSHFRISFVFVHPSLLIIILISSLWSPFWSTTRNYHCRHHHPHHHHHNSYHYHLSNHPFDCQPEIIIIIIIIILIIITTLITPFDHQPEMLAPVSQYRYHRLVDSITVSFFVIILLSLNDNLMMRRAGLPWGYYVDEDEKGLLDDDDASPMII